MRARNNSSRNSCASALHVLECVIDRRIRMRVWISQSVTPGGEVRRIHHWENHVSLVDESLPLLSDPHVGGIGCGESEDVDRHRYGLLVQLISQKSQLIADDLCPQSPIR